MSLIDKSANIITPNVEIFCPEVEKIQLKFWLTKMRHFYYRHISIQKIKRPFTLVILRFILIVIKIIFIWNKTPQTENAEVQGVSFFRTNFLFFESNIKTETSSSDEISSIKNIYQKCPIITLWNSWLFVLWGLNFFPPAFLTEGYPPRK